MALKKITIAIDGHSSTGKSTMAKALARRIGYAYVDTGAMYRAVTLFALRNKLIKGEKVDEKALKEHLKRGDIMITFRPTKDGKSVTVLNGKNVERYIRSMRVSNVVSIIAAIGFVRKAMVKQQQAMGKDKGVVMDGRDIGTVVFPDAEMKVFATASAEVRAQRRFDELRAKGDTTTTFEEVLENVTTPDQYELLEMSKISGFVGRAKGTGRPTKKDRRSLEDFQNEVPEFFGDFEFDMEDGDEE